MSVGASTLSLSATQAVKTLAVSGGPVWFRNLVTITLTGHAGHTPGNLILLVYRGSTLVAYADGFSGSDASCTGTLDTNTSEMEDVLDSLPPGVIRDFDLFLYDSDPTSLDLLAMGTLPVLAVRDYVASSPIAPISDTTVFIGSFAFYNGKTYIRSSEDGLYYEFAAAGSGDTVTESLETTGITIPGSP